MHMTRFCTSCGQPANDGVRFCTHCGAPLPPASNPQSQQQYQQPQPQYQQPQQQYQQPQYQQPQQQHPQSSLIAKPDTHLVMGILTTIFCCLPFGIVSIIQATKVDNLWNAGQYADAQAASKKARNWAIAAAATGLVTSIIYVILMSAGVIAGFNY